MRKDSNSYVIRNPLPLNLFWFGLFLPHQPSLAWIKNICFLSLFHEQTRPFNCIIKYHNMKTVHRKKETRKKWWKCIVMYHLSNYCYLPPSFISLFLSHSLFIQPYSCLLKHHFSAHYTNDPTVHAHKKEKAIIGDLLYTKICYYIVRLLLLNIQKHREKWYINTSSSALSCCPNSVINQKDSLQWYSIRLSFIFQKQHGESKSNDFFFVSCLKLDLLSFFCTCKCPKWMNVAHSFLLKSKQKNGKNTRTI